MKHFLSAIAFLFMAATAHAGYQFGVVCKDVGNARYLFSEGYAGSGSNPQSFLNPTLCLEGDCQRELLGIQGITAPSGIGLGKAIHVEVGDDEFSKVAGHDLRIVLAKGQVLVCGGRRHLSAIPGQGN